jgi:Mrp family chromosome partitioning ATPase
VKQEEMGIPIDLTLDIENPVQASEGSAGSEDEALVRPTVENLPARIPIRIERSSEHFSHLHTAVEYLATPSAIRTHELMDRSLFEGQRSIVLGVTSAIAGEGKTTIALHLAMSIARNSFKKVCLIDLSLSRNTLAQRLGVASERGIVDVLEDGHHSVPTIESDDCKGFFFIPSGKVPDNPNRVARSPFLPEVIAASRELYDVVVVELPSVNSGNVLPIKPYVDGLMMVVWAGVTPREVVNAAIEKLGRDKMMGTVMNRAQDHVPAWLRRFFRI